METKSNTELVVHKRKGELDNGRAPCSKNQMSQALRAKKTLSVSLA